MWSCACARAWLSLSPHKHQQTLFSLFLSVLKIIMNVMRDKHIIHRPHAIRRLNVKMGAKAVVLTMTTYKLSLQTSAIFSCLMTLCWPWQSNSIFEEASNMIIRTSLFLSTNWQMSQSRVHCQIREDLDHNRITLRSHQLCLGFYSLVKVFHHHDHMRAEECLLGLPLSTNPLPWEKTCSW